MVLGMAEATVSATIAMWVMPRPPPEPGGPARPPVARSLFAFLALPGVFAIAVPVAIVYFVGAVFMHALGLVPLAVGLAALLWCVRDFHISGRGTLAPWAPPARLVTAGLYRYTRNPMYAAIMLMLAGWAIAFGSWVLSVYAAVMAAAFHLRVVYGEEPHLARVHGDDWMAYARRVRRWLL